MVEPSKDIDRLTPYNPPLEGRMDKLRLDFNENVAGCSPKVLDALMNIRSEQLSAYPEYDRFLKEVSENFKIGKDNILLSAGTDEGIKLILETYLNRGDEIVIPVPTFSMFSFYATRLGAKITRILFNDDLSFPTKRVIEALKTQPKIIVLVNPNNPTGTLIPEFDLIKIIENAKNSLILLDEAYYQFCGSSLLTRLDAYDNLVIMRTFSKAFGLAGIRLGMIFSNKEIIAILRKSNSPYSVSSLSTILASAALKDKEFISQYVNEIIEQRERCYTELTRRGYTVYPSAANFLLVDFGEKYRYIIRALRDHDILVRDRSNYPLLKNCVRITIGPRNAMDRFLDLLAQIEKSPGIIFDMDGVLVDVSQSYRKAILLTVQYFLGRDIDQQAIQKLKEEGGYNNDWELTHELIGRNGKNLEFEEVKDKFQEIYHGIGDNSGLLDNEVWLLSPHKIQELSKSYPLAVFTGRPKEEAIYQLEKYALTSTFDMLITMDDIPSNRAKPNPFGLQVIVEKLRLSDGWYFGDTVDDMIAAKRANLRAIGVLPPSIQSDDLQNKLLEAGADDIINSIQEIKETLE
jgi:histidinol-phosphate aminotransferase